MDREHEMMSMVQTVCVTHCKMQTHTETPEGRGASGF
jgi:hypothetical protein